MNELKIARTANLISSHYKECTTLTPPCKFDCPCYFESKEALEKMETKNELPLLHR